MSNTKRQWLMAGTALLTASVFATAASAQSAPAAQDPQEPVTQVDDIVVVGSNIRGASTTAALPVVVMDREAIQDAGVVSGDDLFRSIPQMGDVLFEAANNPQTSNSARGDVNSVNLRSLGVGNTLVLINGRRMVQHPTSQGTSDTGTVPVLSYNSNAIPVAGLERVEVLLDGAAAIYGADAVAGVVNTVMRDDFDGVTFESQYGGAEGTGFTELELNLFAGKDLDRGNISLYASYTDRSELWADEQEFTRTDDLRPLFNQYPGFETTDVPDGRSSHTPWGRFQLPGFTSSTRPRYFGTRIASTSGTFRIQPASFGCDGAPLDGGLCLVSGVTAYNSTNREMRYDTRVDTTVRSSIERVNLFASGYYELTDSIEFFGEAGFYAAESRAVQPPVINLNDLWIPASNYWNPFGPVTFSDGSPNPNRLPGLTFVPNEGLPVYMGNHRFVDAGFQDVTVENYQVRLLGGLRGEWAGFDWETALLYSGARATDSSPNVNSTALQQSLALSTPDAYNPFNGGCVDTPSYGDCTPSSPVAIDAILFQMERVSETTLTLADFKMSRSDLWSLPGGNVGVAFGVEFRHETQMDDRDENLDGTFTFTDMVSGEVNQSNVAAVSPNPDTEGSRDVFGAFVEFAVPVVSPEMNIPLVRSLDVQLAGRFENYSDFGSVAKPKIALAWDIVDGVRVRASYSEGFRAPNLEQVNATQYARLATNTDYVRCEADLRQNAITSFNDCGRTASASLLIAGNPDLEPEESTNRSVGLVFQPTFVPVEWGDFTFTVDHWTIEQEKIVGLLGAQTALALDYLLRVQGSSNPNVVRAAPDADDDALFDGTGLASAGTVLSINDSFVNLLPQTVEGVDFGIRWSKRRTAWGTFNFTLNASKMLEYSRPAGPIVDQLLAAREAGTINALTPLPLTSQLIAVDGRPEWRAMANVNWSKGPWRVGVTAHYTSEIEQPDLLSDAGEPWVVEDQLTFNLYGQFEFENLGPASGARVRLGVRDLTDEGPPLAEGGYLGSIHRPYGRYWYASVSKTF
ncbi:MAG: TonB-dependent receptor [Brevundimonas sp.]|uniref:TonB-dependent receptor domain-containing protein n=1 Tax=Brevundimonas sp. TaxID=1871086 RepID=UPI00300272C7